MKHVREELNFLCAAGQLKNPHEANEKNQIQYDLNKIDVNFY